MFIQTEGTPNPATLKFLPGVEVMGAGRTADFREPEKAAVSPLARRLFDIEGVAGVYLGSEFISVTKDDAVEWHHLKPPILGAIMEHFTAGLPIMEESATDDGGHSADADLDDAVVGQIVELLDTRVRPVVAQDGGDIVFHGYENGVVFLHMQGACSGCPASAMTLKSGIENLLKHYVPEVQEVRSV